MTPLFLTHYNILCYPIGKEWGEGTRRYGDGCEYKGCWVDGKRSGEGTTTAANTGRVTKEKWWNDHKVIQEPRLQPDAFTVK